MPLPGIPGSVKYWTLRTRWSSCVQEQVVLYIKQLAGRRVEAPVLPAFVYPDSCSGE